MGLGNSWAKLGWILGKIQLKQRRNQGESIGVKSGQN